MFPVTGVYMVTQNVGCMLQSWLPIKILQKKNYEVFNKLLPTNRQIDTWGGSSVSYLQNNFLIKEKLAMRKCFVRFKERVLTLKFRAFQHLWKEDMRLLSMRKHRPKAQKRIELSSRTSHAGYQKHRSSIRARFTLPAGNLTLVPTTEVVDFAGKLLLDSRIKLYRNSLKMPALILDEKEKRLSRFVTRNGLIEDPCSVEQERSMINPWTSKEKEIFLETLATFGKNFKKIASFLEHKTIADCIQFYYKNQKSECFENVKKKLDVKKQGRSFLTNTYLVTSGKKWSREANSASLDMLGAVSVIAAHADESLNTHHTSGKKKFLAGPRGYKTFCGDDAVLEPSSCVDILGNEKEAVAADVLAGICGALSSEAMCSCVTSSVGLGEGCPERKCQKVNINDRPSTSEVMQNVDDEETCSGESCGELDSGDWTDDEKSIFIRALRSYGKDFAIISRCVGTRSRDQCKIFFSKARKCLGLDVLHLGSGNEGMPVSGTNGGRSDTEDACVVETDSVICSTQSSSKMDVNLPFSVTNTGVGAFEHAGTTDMTDLEGSGEKNCMVPLDCEDTERGISSVFLNDCQAGVKTALVFDGGNNFTERVGNIGATPEVLQGNDVKVDSTLNSDETRVLHGSAVLPGDKETGKEEAIQQTISPTKESVSTGGPREPDLSRSNAAVELQIVPGATAEELKTDSEGRKPTVPEKGLGDGQCANSWVNTNSKTSSSCCVAPDSNACGNGIVSAADNSVHTGFSLTANYQRQISLELLPSIQKSQIISWQQQNCPVPASLVLQNASAVHFEDPLRQATSSTTLKFDELGNKKHQESANVDVCQQYLLGHHPLSTVESSQVLRGYPLRVLNKKEIDGESDSKSGKKSAVLQSFSKINRNSQSNQCFVQDLYYDNCNGSTLPNSVAELPLPLKSQEQLTSDHPRPHFRSSSDTEENLRRTGDVKLFGQILSHPSLLQKPNPPSHESDDNGMSKPSGKSFNLKCTPDQGTVRTSAKAKLDPINCSGVEEIPTRSYGFWDGNRIQTGLSSPPDSALLLAKYPAVFRDYSTSSCRVEQQPLPAVTRSDRNLGSISVFPTKDVSDPGGLTDYQVYRSYDGTKVQPFTVDVKQQDIFSELQKRSKGFEALSGFQQQGRVVGMKGGGILVGGSCTGVSDPVAAIKMHYATTERYGGQAGSIREGESWRGDIGR